MREIVPGVFQSGLPLVRDLRGFVDIGGKTVVDLTRRPRDTQRKACNRFGIQYVKHGLQYHGGDCDGAVHAVLKAERPVLFFCFHGRDRSGIVARRLVMREIGTVALYRVGRNIARAHRTCAAMGVQRMALIECKGTLDGRLYSADDRIIYTTPSEIPQGPGVVALEDWATMPISEVDWPAIHTLVLGGETGGLPRGLDVTYARIPQVGRLCLTVEAALAVALHEWRG